jgi:Tfp pilus assembly protein PilF
VKATRGDTSGAIQAFQAAVARFPPFKSAHYGLATAYSRMGDSTKAEEQFRLFRSVSAVEPPIKDPLLAKVRTLDIGFLYYSNKGSKLWNAGAIEQAAEAYEKALEIEPRHVLSHIHLIAVYAKLGRFDSAERHYHDAVVNQGRYSEAGPVLQKALDLDGTFPEAHFALAIIAEKENRREEARRQCQMALESKPDYAEARAMLERLTAGKSARP